MTESERAAMWFRFWSKVRITDGCWIWTASTHKTSPNMIHKGQFPYGRIGFGGSGEVRKAHRMAYELYYESIPEGMFVLHSCDNTRCVRPDHLKLGTHLENMADMVRRGRSSRGEGRPLSKLTCQDVTEIRMLSTAGLKQAWIARRFGVNGSVVSEIINMKAWKHI